MNFASYPQTPVTVGPLSPPQGGQGAAAHLAVVALTDLGPEGVEYTYLVARQGDVLLTSVTGNGNGSGAELDAFARRYFSIARQKLAGTRHSSVVERGVGGGP